MNNSFLETAEAKAIKLMRLSDPDFDIYSMELEMSHIAKKIFEKFLEMDADYIKGVTSGQALDYFMRVTSYSIVSYRCSVARFGL